LVEEAFFFFRAASFFGAALLDPFLNANVVEAGADFLEGALNVCLRN
jgi:hypothetical protein